jgi:hypothetical protein
MRFQSNRRHGFKIVSDRLNRKRFDRLFGSAWILRALSHIASATVDLSRHSLLSTKALSETEDDGGGS